MVKGIILAGGLGSRLFPLTFSTSKQLLPVYDKPMIYYPLSVLMNAGIKDILIITTPNDLNRYKSLFSDGTQLGIKINYLSQSKPRGIAESFIIAQKFISDKNVCLILGDNIFYGEGLNKLVHQGIDNLSKNYSTIFGVKVKNPNQFGVIEYDSKNNISKICEKPKSSKSDLIVSGLYFYTNDVVKFSKSLKPSSRGELEITDINNIYLKKNSLKLIKIGENISWIDTGTHKSITRASNFFQDIEINTGKKAACIEEIAYDMGYINLEDFKKLIYQMKNSSYGDYLYNKLKYENN
tara:strand:- start:10197 stop:11081 length:885 start_codon:yes stop_codon:yes gene_type:complete